MANSVDTNLTWDYNVCPGLSVPIWYYSNLTNYGIIKILYSIPLPPTHPQTHSVFFFFIFFFVAIAPERVINEVILLDNSCFFCTKTNLLVTHWNGFFESHTKDKNTMQVWILLQNLFFFSQNNSSTICL